MLQQSQTTYVHKRTKKVTPHEPVRTNFMRLTLTDRRKILREQARKLLDCYTRNTEITGMGGEISLAAKPKRGEIWLVNLDPTIGAEI